MSADSSRFSSVGVAGAVVGRAAGGGARNSASGLSSGLVVRETTHVSPRRIEVRGPSLRGVLQGLSRRRRISRMRRTVLRFADVARDGMAAGGGAVGLVMMTLTYACAEDWRPCHISTFCQRCCEWLERRNHSYGYAWVIEMQKRGAPHYHVLFWLPEGVKLPRPDTCAFGQRTPLWPHGLTRIERARSPGYIVKYASKGEDEPLPFGARLFGIGAHERVWRKLSRWAALPAWLRNLSEEGDVLARVAHVGWVNRSTGVIHESQWRYGFSRDEEGWVVWFERREVEAEAGAPV
jgi:hypothetical protein